MSYRTVFFLLFFFLAGSHYPAQASAAIDVSPAAYLDLSKLVETCTSSPDKDITNIITRDCLFTAATPQTLQPGFSTRAHWLRLHLYNHAAHTVERWLRIGHPRLERVTFFEDIGHGKWRRSETGLIIPQAQHPEFSIDSVLRITLAPEEQRTIFVRVLSDTSINLTPTLWQNNAYLSSVSKRSNSCAFIIGAQIITCIFTFIIFLKWNEICYLYFSICEITLGVFTACFGGLMPVYLWPDTKAFDTRIQFVALGLSIFFFALFSRRFVGIHRHYRTYDKILMALAGIVATATVWAYFSDLQHGVYVILAGTLAVKFTCILLFWHAGRDGLRPAYFLLISNLIVLCGAAQMIFKTFGGIPPNDTDTVMLMMEFLLSAPIGIFGIALHYQQLENRLQQAEQESKAKIEFLAHMSHELRTPLNTILGTAQLLSRHADRQTLAAGLADIGDSGRHLLKMIDEILDHARGLAGKLSLSPSPFDWKNFLSSIERNARMLAAHKGNSFSLHVSGEINGTLILDERRLRQVLDNLLTNAARHTRQGWIHLDCALHPSQADGTITLAFAVTDNGEGIAVSDQERIFRPFERGHGMMTRGDGKGVGMGLAISRQLVNLMGGTLSVNSRPGKGACFHFQLVAKTQETQIKQAHFPPDLVLNDRKQRTILIVEDEDKNRNILTTLLQESGFRVITAKNGRQALQRCPPSLMADLVLTDQFMHDGDGWMVLRRISELCPDVPVVLISAAPPQRPAYFPQTVSFAAHLLKPLEHDEVLRCIRGLLSFDQKEASPHGEPVAPPPFQSLHRPDKADLFLLQNLIENGQISEIFDWAARMHHTMPDFANRVTQAAHALDFPTLHHLAEV